jgi:energy-coupling factor transporter ATP-binding protein EcfA2
VSESASEKGRSATTGGNLRLVPYADNARRHASNRDAELRRSTMIARLRLATFLPGFALLVWALADAAVWRFVLAAVLLGFFALLVAWHARVEERARWHDALRLVNAHGIARIRRDWSSLPPGDAPAEIDLSSHAYAGDLDVFGRASLFQWLGPTATVIGTRVLADWLQQPADAKEIAQRQRAVATLAPHDDWRERFAAHGIVAMAARQEHLDRFLSWAEGPSPFGRYAGILQTTVLTLTGSIAVLGLLNALGILPEVWLVPLLIGVVLSFAFATMTETIFDRAGGGQYALAAYAALIEHAVTAPTSSELLAALRERLSAEVAPAPLWMRRLNRILEFGSLRRGAAILHFPIQALTLWDFHVLFALERWRHHAGARVRRWLDALGQLDALAALARASRDNPSWGMPEISERPVFEAEGLGHPLIADDKRIANDVRVGPPGTILLVTGSNMSGKSTLLRAIGLNAVLSQAGGCVCAARLHMPQTDLQTSIRVQDSLELGLSYFMAALARLKRVVDAAEHERPGRLLLYLLDEILQGTNSAERSTAVRAVARHLLEAGAIGAMTTHDLNIAAEEPLASAAQLVHFTEIVDEDGTMRFDYRLRPGLATSRNALRLMKLIGIDI